MTVTLIINHCISDSGLGDTIRSAYAYFIMSKKLGFKIFYDFTNQNLGNCFDTNINHTCTKDCKFFKDFSKDNEKTHEFINFLTTVTNYPENHIFHVRSNHCYEIVDFKEFGLRENRESFIKWLNKTPKLEARIKQLTPSKNYISIHIRCGDRHMFKQGPCSNDSRIDPLDTKIDQLIHNLAKKETVVLFTDNPNIRQRLNKYCLNTRQAVHIGKKASVEEIIDTVSEFFIIGQATHIFVGVRSGFSYWPSVLFGKKITNLQN